MPTGRPREIRQFVQAQFADLNPECREIEQETLLIRDGQYCGHRYRSHGMSAVWFVEEDELKVTDAGGRVLRIVKPSSGELPRSEAA